MKDPKHYETAWELSKKRFARAQRSLGRCRSRNKQELGVAADGILVEPVVVGHLLGHFETLFGGVCRVLDMASCQ